MTTLTGLRRSQHHIRKSPGACLGMFTTVRNSYKVTSFNHAWDISERVFDRGKYILVVYERFLADNIAISASNFRDAIV